MSSRGPDLASSTSFDVALADPSLTSTLTRAKIDDLVAYRESL